MRVLIVSHNSFSKIYNNGKTLESIFSKFEKEEISQLFFNETDKPDFEYCNNYFRITDVDIIKNIFNPASSCGKVIKPTPSNNLDLKKSIYHRFRKFGNILTLFRDMLWENPVWNKKYLLEWCEVFNPDIIFLVGGKAGFSHKIAMLITISLSRPLITFFTDDYLIYPRNKNIFNIIQKLRMKKFYNNTINHSKLLFAIGDIMAHEYSKYFGKMFIPIMNSVSIKPYIEYEKKHKIIISYFGGLHLNRWKMIVRLTSIIKEFNEVTVNVFSIKEPSNKIKDIFCSNDINYNGKLTGNELDEAIRGSDVLLHIESDESYYRSLTKLSVSTKIPEYLMAGRFILGYGPTEVASMRLLFDNQIGYVISSELNKKEILLKLKGVIDNYDYRKKMGLRGYEFAINNYNNEKIATEFKKQVEFVHNNNLLNRVNSQ
ncbi:MAG: hypothetical protein PHY08_10455 [Candidatus Cloacimonetes bacterium]|nr:hypothetical protein [Candidatus Cloacimonadota bacterium]